MAPVRRRELDSGRGCDGGAKLLRKHLDSRKGRRRAHATRGKRRRIQQHVVREGCRRHPSSVQVQGPVVHVSPEQAVHRVACQDDWGGSRVTGRDTIITAPVADVARTAKRESRIPVGDPDLGVTIGRHVRRSGCNVRQSHRVRRNSSSAHTDGAISFSHVAGSHALASVLNFRSSGPLAMQAGRP